MEFWGWLRRFDHIPFGKIVDKGLSWFTYGLFLLVLILLLITAIWGGLEK